MTAFVLGRDNPLSLDREKLSQSVACGHNLPVDQRVVLGLLRVAFPASQNAQKCSTGYLRLFERPSWKSTHRSSTSGAKRSFSEFGTSLPP